MLYFIENVLNCCIYESEGEITTNTVVHDELLFFSGDSVYCKAQAEDFLWAAAASEEVGTYSRYSVPQGM